MSSRKPRGGGGVGLPFPTPLFFHMWFVPAFLTSRRWRPTPLAPSHSCMSSRTCTLMDAPTSTTTPCDHWRFGSTVTAPWTELGRPGALALRPLYRGHSNSCHGPKALHGRLCTRCRTRGSFRLSSCNRPRRGRPRWVALGPGSSSISFSVCTAPLAGTGSTVGPSWFRPPSHWHAPSPCPVVTRSEPGCQQVRTGMG